jgi:hypothetical protein
MWSCKFFPHGTFNYWTYHHFRKSTADTDWDDFRQITTCDIDKLVNSHHFESWNFCRRKVYIVCFIQCVFLDMNLSFVPCWMKDSLFCVTKKRISNRYDKKSDHDYIYNDNLTKLNESFVHIYSQSFYFHWKRISCLSDSLI